MNYRSASSYADPNVANLQRDSYDYGYGGGRIDLPTVGYNPVYPGTANPTACQYPGAAYVHGRPNQTFASPYANTEYNPNYSNYNHQYHQEYRDPTPTSIITVNSKSRYSLNNTLPRSQANTMTSQPSRQPVERIADAEPISDGNEVQVVEQTTNNQASQTSRKTPNTSTTPPNLKTQAGGKITKQSGYQDHYNASHRKNQDFGYAPWHRPSLNNYHASHMHYYPGHMQQYHHTNYSMPYYHHRRPAYSSKDNSSRTSHQKVSINKGLIPFVQIPDDTKSLILKLDPDNFECFCGPSNIFTMQHVTPVLIDENIYESIDHYYQYCKLMDLCGNCTNKITGAVRDRRGNRQDGKKDFNNNENTFSFSAKEQLRLYGVSIETVENWRRTKGLKVLQSGYSAKISQNLDFRMALQQTGEKILVHAFDRDVVYGIGLQGNQIKKWCADMKSSGNTTLKIPANFPLTEETVKHCPTFCHGRNILGVILMLLRESLIAGTILTSDMKALFNAILEGKEVETVLFEDSFNSNDFSIGGGAIQSMES